jgi:hypothetical protein
VKWHQQVALRVGAKHSDTMAVVRAGRAAKLRTRRLNRRQGKPHWPYRWTATYPEDK